MMTNPVVSFRSPSGERWVFPLAHLLARRLRKEDSLVSFYFSSEVIDLAFETPDQAVEFWDAAQRDLSVVPKRLELMTSITARRQ